MIEKIIDRLEGVREIRPGDYYAKCCAHDDKTPSLHITERDNRILIYCFAGCSADNVLDAIGLQWADLYSDRDQAAYAAALAVPIRAPKVDPLEHERLILEIAAGDLRRGEKLSLEDIARVQLARERLGIAS